jgi:hypothetical protein
MAYPKTSGYGKLQRRKLISKKIKVLKKEGNLIKTNHLAHIAKDIDDLKDDMKDVKIEVFRFKYIAYGAIVVFVLMSDKFTEILRLL